MRADDGQTILALGVIRPYKGLADAVEVVRRLPDARLLVAGDPAMPLDGLREAPRTEWRLGYLDAGRARAGALGGDDRALPLPRRARPVGGAPAGARRRACRSSPTTSAGWPSRSVRYGAGRVVPAGDVDALTEAAARAARRSAPRSPRRAPAPTARGAELTWEAAAARPPRPLPRARVIFRRGRFADVIATPARPVRARHTTT